MKNFKKIAFGITNQCKDNHVIPFFDYDGKEYKYAEKDLLSMQKEFKLSEIYIIKSTNGFNAFSLDKLTFDILRSMYFMSSDVDMDFIKYGLQRGFMTLRMGDDKQFYRTLYPRPKNTYFVKSNAHFKFFTEIMNFPLNKKGKFDGYKEIVLSMFPSNKHGFNKTELVKHGFDV